MKLLCSLVLCALVACGSKSGTSGEAKPGSGSGSGSAVIAPAAPKAVAIAFVFQGQEVWVGNDDVEPPEGDPMPGVLKSFKTAWKGIDLKELPAGSKATVISYGEQPTVRRPMGPIETLAPEAFGDQKDYRGVIDRHLVEGVTMGLDELKKVTDARRVLVVIGDGTDARPETAKPSLEALGKRAAAENVELVSIIYAGQLSQPATVIRALDPKATAVNTVDAIAEQLHWSLVRLSQPASPPASASTTPAPFTLALLLQGSEVWIGNDADTPADDPSRMPGALNAIRAAFERTPLTGFPPGSQAMVITYADKATTKLPLIPIEKLDARAIGVQHDYHGTIGTELVGGVRHALTALAKTPSSRRVLVILGDGGDTNNETARAQLQQLAKDAANMHVDIYAIVYKGALSDPTTVVTELDPKAATAKTADEITADLSALLRVLPSK